MKKTQIVFLFLISWQSAIVAAEDERTILVAGAILAASYLATLMPNAYEWYLLQNMDHENLFDYSRLFYERSMTDYQPVIQIAKKVKPERAKQHELLDYIYDTRHQRYCFVEYVQQLSYSITKGAKYLDVLKHRVSLLQPVQSDLVETARGASLAHGYKILIDRLEKLLQTLEPVKALIVSSYSYQDQLYAYQLEQYS
ncbi:MAG: hypothetical protein WD068_03290 [Candidatus Babeliales bacterium]